jgi:predicted metal-dependent HD superfamily phosphohydrolase
MHFHLQACRHMVMDWDSMVFALFYHDFVYNATSKNNEENSAVEAEKRLTALRLPIDKIAQVVQLIDATKSHKVSSDNDVNLFTDSDLSILGSPHAEYELYCSNVRKEYSIFPDILYKPGRRKVLRHFLDMPYIFKTDFFRSKLESIARQNIKTELNKLI